MSPPQWVTHSVAGILNCTSRERELNSSIYCSPLPYCGCHVTSFFQLPPPWLPVVTDCICRLWARISLFFLKLLLWRPFITAAGKEMKSVGLRSRNFVLHNCNSLGSWASNDGLMSGTKGKEEAPKPAGCPMKTMNTWSPESNNLYPLLSLPQGQQLLPTRFMNQRVLAADLQCFGFSREHGIPSELSQWTSLCGADAFKAQERIRVMVFLQLPTSAPYSILLFLASQLGKHYLLWAAWQTSLLTTAFHWLRGSWGHDTSGGV